MNIETIPFTVIPFLLIPLLLYIIFINSRTSTNVQLTKSLIRTSTILNLVLVAFGSYMVVNYDVLQAVLFEWQGLGFSLRIDPLNLIILGMIAIIGSVVMSFSFNYLEGDKNHNQFLGNLAATIAAVQLFVLSENLLLLFIAWVLTSLHLNKLLLYYPERKRAQTAAKKKFIIARIGDLSMLIAFTLLYIQFQTADISSLFEKAQNLNEVPLQLEVAMLLLAITALLKSAQLPFHGWLIEVMEAPTPVSALLHAGLINAGPFLMIRFSVLLSITEIAPLVLLIVGAASALFGAIVYSTQTSVKTALGYSSVAHMGFSIMVCGIGVYPASLLHLTAHSFYKAHAFLSSGSTIDTAKIYNYRSQFRTANGIRILLGILVTIFVFGALATYYLDLSQISFPYVFISAIIFLAIITLLTSTIDSKSSLLSLFNATVFSALIIAAFFSLEYVMSEAIHTQIPKLINATTTTTVVASVILFLFSATVLIYLLTPIVQNHNGFKRYSIHVRNGFYLNLYFDRLIGANKINPSNFSKK